VRYFIATEYEFLLSCAATWLEDGMKLQSIQILRGMAALLVVVYHIRAMEILAIGKNGLQEVPLLNGFVANGYAGVDLFFVISGFIMVYVTDGMKAGYRTSLDFLFARVTRIYPLWWLFAAVMTAMFFLYNDFGFGAGWQHVSQGQPLIPYLIKSFLLVPQNAHPVLGVGWTLVHEMYFYAAFTFMLLLPRRVWLWVLLAWGAAIAGGTLIGFTEPFGSDYRSLFFYPMTMEFILGAVVGLLVSSGVAWRSGILTMIAVLWLMATLGLQGADDANLMMWGRVFWFGLPCTLLVYGFATLEITRRQAWLVPAGIGAFVAGLVGLGYNLLDTAPWGARSAATLMSVIVGAVAMAAVFWGGWLGGQAAPARIRAMKPSLSRIYNGLARVGDWSFSLYLCHPILLAPIRLAFAELAKIPALAPVFQTGHAGPLDNIVLYVVALTTCLIVAALTYRFVERPMIIGFSKARGFLFRRERPKPLGQVAP
jgi:peptidoglycan/LPS O-acetylase OafA/YrhL